MSLGLNSAMLPKTSSVLLGVIFIFLGVLGFVDNPVIGTDATFYSDRGHNIFFILTGIAFFIAALLDSERARICLIVIGFLYLLLGLIGLLTIGASATGKVVGMRVNGADNLLHIALGVIILLFGLTAKRTVIVV
jgi:hypothetical protein